VAGEEVICDLACPLMQFVGKVYSEDGAVDGHVIGLLDFGTRIGAAVVNNKPFGPDAVCSCQRS